METGEENLEPDLTIEIKGKERWLVVRDGGFIARERIPLHVIQIEDQERQIFHMKEICIALHEKIERLKKLGNNIT